MNGQSLVGSTVIARLCSGVDDVVDDQARATCRSVHAGEAQRTEVERHALPPLGHFSLVRYCKIQ